MLDKLRKTGMLWTFSETVEKMANVIEDLMSYAADLAKSTGPSMACKALRVVNTACSSACNFSNMSFIKYVITSAGFQKMKGSGECMVEIGPGNMFAKKFVLRDNFFGFNGFLNEYRVFLYIYERCWNKVKIRGRG